MTQLSVELCIAVYYGYSTCCICCHTSLDTTTTSVWTPIIEMFGYRLQVRIFHVRVTSSICVYSSCDMICLYYLLGASQYMEILMYRNTQEVYIVSQYEMHIAISILTFHLTDDLFNEPGRMSVPGTIYNAMHSHSVGVHVWCRWCAWTKTLTLALTFKPEVIRLSCYIIHMCVPYGKTFHNLWYCNFLHCDLDLEVWPIFEKL